MRKMETYDQYAEYSLRKMAEHEAAVYRQELQQAQKPKISPYRRRSGSGSAYVEKAQQQQALIELPTGRSNLRKCSSLQCSFEKDLCDFEVYNLQAEASYMRYICIPLASEEGRFQRPPQGSRADISLSKQICEESTI